MLNDILTVMWKESKGFLRVRGRRSQALFALVSPLFLAILMPVQFGEVFVRSPITLVTSFIVALILVGVTIPDAFAGERERHTLRTLLASRLPDRAILLGKLATSVVYAWAASVVVLLIGLVTVNVVHGHGQLLLYTPSMVIANLVFSLLIALLTGAIGILFSMRAATAQEAQQSTMGVLLIVPMLLQFVAMFLLGSTSGREWLSTALSRVSLDQALLVVLGFFALLDAVVLWAAMSRFRRAQLIVS